jgi:hypothetical protein
MKQILFILFVISAIIWSCSSLKKVKSSSIKQGITGLITETKGNQMPSPDVPTSSPKGISTTVFVYEPTHITQVTKADNAAFYTSISTKMVASVETDSAGVFILALPVGSYSIFVKQGKGFYANLFDTNNNIALFNVEADKLTNVKLTVSSKAAF